jgi:hypothetical protein
MGDPEMTNITTQWHSGASCATPLDWSLANTGRPFVFPFTARSKLFLLFQPHMWRLEQLWAKQENWLPALYTTITSTKSPSCYITTFSASLTKLTAVLPQSRDYSCYVSRRTLAPPPLRLQKHTDLCAHGFAHSADVWHQPRLANLNCAWHRILCGIIPAIVVFSDFMLVTTCCDQHQHTT